jgi:FkbM family methyltransferase
MRPLVNRLLPDSLAVVTVRQGRNRGARFAIYPRTEKYYWTGTYEAELQEVLWARLRPGGVFWDVGAHIGFFSVLASRRVDTCGRVVAIEPSPENLARLRRVLALNDASNVAILPLAVLERSGDAGFLPSGSSSTGTVVGAGAADAVRVHARSLDGLLEYLPRPDVVKIDVEGAEVSVLRGGRRLLAEDNPLLVVEFTGVDAVSRARSLTQWDLFQPFTDRHWLLRAGAG